MKWRTAKLLDRTFAVGMILKGLDGVLEMLGGVILFLVSASTISNIVSSLTQHELSEDPHDVISAHLLKTAHGLTGSAVTVGAAYLLSHGVVKVVLVAAVLKEKLWAYPWMIAFLVAFIVYQIDRMTFAPSVGLAGLTVFDVFITWLTVLEYKKHRAASRMKRADGSLAATP